jgi:hypothetical protein
VLDRFDRRDRTQSSSLSSLSSSAAHIERHHYNHRHKVTLRELFTSVGRSVLCLLFPSRPRFFDSLLGPPSFLRAAKVIAKGALAPTFQIPFPSVNACTSSRQVVSVSDAALLLPANRHKFKSRDLRRNRPLSKLLLAFYLHGARANSASLFFISKPSPAALQPFDRPLSPDQPSEQEAAILFSPSSFHVVRESSFGPDYPIHCPSISVCSVALGSAAAALTPSSSLSFALFTCSLTRSALLSRSSVTLSLSLSLRLVSSVCASITLKSGRRRFVRHFHPFLFSIKVNYLLRTPSLPLPVLCLSLSLSLSLTLLHTHSDYSNFVPQFVNQTQKQTQHRSLRPLTSLSMSLSSNIDRP